MPRRLLLPLTALLLHEATSAQSQVHVFGIVDLYAAHASGGAVSRTRLESGGSADSRFGFRGVEDLGGGLSARFVLEAGFSADTGHEGATPISFARQSFLGLSGAWGSLDLGRMYTPMFTAMSRADPFALNTDFSPMNLGAPSFPLPAATSGAAAPRPFAPRGSNMIRYRSPASRGVVLDLAYAPGEAAAPSERSAELYGGSLGWKHGAWWVAYAFQSARSGTATQPVAQPVATRYQSLSATYEATERLRLSAIVSHSQTRGSAAPAGKQWSVGLNWRVGGPSTVLAGFGHRRLDGNPESRRTWTLGYEHALSRRTAAYARLLHASDHGSPRATTPLAGATGGRVYALGLRHSF